MSGADVVIVCEAGKGQTETANARLIAVGAEFAARRGGRLVCLIAGNDIGAKANELSGYVDEVRVADAVQYEHYDPLAHLRAVAGLVEEIQPGAVFFGHTYVGMDLAPRLAAKLRVGVASNCFGLAIEGEAVYFLRPMYRGRVHAKVALETRPYVATMQIGSSRLSAPNSKGSVVRLETAPAETGQVRPLKTIEPERGEIDISKAEIVVSGGRGVGTKENYALVSELAEALGGVAACSRPLVDMGWFPSARQVGLSGNTVKPKLYVACGISGAIEHLHGMKESGIIVAINKDPGAPIFKAAHIGMVGDLNDIVPALISEARAARGSPRAKKADE